MTINDRDNSQDLATLGDLVEAHLAGDPTTVPSEMSGEFSLAVQAHEALRQALGETVLWPDANTDSEPMPPPALPSDYEIVRELGRGGMGVVYLVRQQSLGRQVAVKVLRPGGSSSGAVAKRFLEEARHLARLRHKNIVSIHEVGDADNEPYFTMDYVEGETLSNLINRERLSPSRSIKILKQVADAVQHAHENGIIHRDLKPGNVLLDSAGAVFVTDFGLARDMSQDSHLTRSGEIMGTPAYMAPEQAAGKSELVGETTDVHALGVILYEMLTGRPPYGAGSSAEVLLRLLKEEPTAPRRIDRRIPRDIETICLKAMAKSPDARYATVSALLEDLRRFEGGESIAARRPGFLVYTARVLKHRWKTMVVFGVAIAVVLYGASWMFGPDADDYIAEGDTFHSGGKHRSAADAYRQALSVSPAHFKGLILERLFRCQLDYSDREAALATALRLAETERSAWFGDLNYDVAVALAAPVSASTASRDCQRTARVRFALERLEIALRSPGLSAAQRAKLENLRLTVRRRLAQRSAGSDLARVLELPTGSREQLENLERDESRDLVQRAKAALAAGMACERSGDIPAAQSHYAQGVAWLRSVFPVYSGLTDGTIRMASPRSMAYPPKKQLLLQELQSRYAGVDRQSAPKLGGGLRLRVSGIDLPPDLALNLWIGLRPVTANQKSPLKMLGSAPVQLDQTAFVGVFDGTYQLEVQRGGSGSQSSGHRGARASYFLSMLELDLASIPKVVRIEGGVVKITIRGHLLERVQLLSPAGSEVDLATEVFRWSPLPDAAHYDVRLKEVKLAGGGVYYNPACSVKSRTNTLCFGQVAADTIEWKRPLAAGSEFTWEVTAFDATGRRIGKCEGDRRIKVRAGLGGK